MIMKIGKWLKKFKKISNSIVKQWNNFDTTRNCSRVAKAKLKNYCGNGELTLWNFENDYGNGENGNLELTLWGNDCSKMGKWLWKWRND